MMSILILLLIATLTACTPKQEAIDFQQILEAAQDRANQAQSLSEDTLLVQALEHYQNLEPKDSARLSQATILTAYHYWWKGEKTQAYEILRPLAETDKNALEAIFVMANRDYDFESCYEYLSRLLKEDTRDNFWYQQAWATLHFYINQP